MSNPTTTVEAAPEHLITLRIIAPGKVTGSCSCGEWHPDPVSDSEVIRTQGELHKAMAAGCPKCHSVEAWHGVIVGPGEPERFACDECGMWMSVQAVTPAPVEPPKMPRPLDFKVEIDNGQLFVDVCGYPVLAFRPGYYLQIGNLTIHGRREEDRLQEMWTRIGRSSERLEQRAAERRAS